MKQDAHWACYSAPCSNIAARGVVRNGEELTGCPSTRPEVVVVVVAAAAVVIIVDIIIIIIIIIMTTNIMVVVTQNYTLLQMLFQYFHTPAFFHLYNHNLYML
jgi:hypothetical protein